MVTKWKKFSRQPLVKMGTCIIIAVALLLGSFSVANWFIWSRNFYAKTQSYTTSHYGNYYGNHYGNWTISKEEYAYNQLQEYLPLAQQIALLQSEKYISSGDYFTDFEIDSQTKDWIGRNQEYEDYRRKYGDYEDRPVVEETANPKNNGEIPLEMKLAAITDLGNLIFELENSPMEYYIKTGDTVYSSLENKGRPASIYHLSVNNHILTRSDNLYSLVNGLQKEFMLQSSVDSIYIGTNVVDFEAFSLVNSEYKNQTRNHMFQILLIGGIGFLALVNLLVGAGRKERDQGQNLHLNTFDSIFLDVGLGIGSLLFLITVLTAQYMVLDLLSNSKAAYYIAAGAIAVIPGFYGVAWLNSLTKHVKKGKWWRHTLLYHLFHKGKEIASGMMKQLGRLQTKYWLFFSVGVLGVLGLLTFVFPPLILLDGLVAIAFVVYMYCSINKVTIAAKDIEQGRLDRPIKGLTGSFQPLAQSLESIATGVDIAVTQRMKSERLKTDLITNVSHDIRTPLTSLITYTDLLKSKGLDHPEAASYVDILVQKSYRLKDLTEDLFEATKAASGDIPINIETIDFSQLFHQSLGEMEDKRKSSLLDFHLTIPEHAYVKGDGRLLARVLENLFSNIFKYAQPKSRVYIDLLEKEDTYELTMKNISEHSLNISADQLTERFFRGDESRSSEGSGLGLSIVESFVQVQGGKVDISIDGDLFKTVLSLEKEKLEKNHPR